MLSYLTLLLSWPWEAIDVLLDDIDVLPFTNNKLPTKYIQKAFWSY